jgi:hypothetical protein
MGRGIELVTAMRITYISACGSSAEPAIKPGYRSRARRYGKCCTLLAPPAQQTEAGEAAQE